MLLKCRFLSKFTPSEMSKFRYLDSDTVTKAVEMCPFMSQAIRNMTSVTNTVSNQPKQESQSRIYIFTRFLKKFLKIKSSFFNIKAETSSHEINKNVCTNTINCPFFNKGNIELNNLVKKKNLEDLNESNQVNILEKTKNNSKIIIY